MGKRGLGEEVVREPVGEARHRVRGQRRDHERVGVGQVRIRVGGRLLPRKRPERPRGDELLRPTRDDRRDVVPRADEEPDELTGLVGGDAARHADEDSRHGHSVPGRVAACPRSGQWRGSGGTGRFPQLLRQAMPSTSRVAAYEKVSLPREISSIAIVR